MARVAALGKPDLFITMTCNPKWFEILSCLLPGQSANDRPDIVSRVFYQKVLLLLTLLLEHSVLGKVIAHNGRIEFQKRGLPHLHLLIVFADVDKPRTIEDIDRLVSAQLPDPHTHPLLHSTVAKHMVHGPCGPLNPACVCMVDKPDGCPGEKHCDKKYPKDFVAASEITDDGYPRYARQALVQCCCWQDLHVFIHSFSSLNLN